MTLATTAIEFFESITEFLQSVGDDLSLFHEYQSLYSKHGISRFNASLQEVYATYLHFCSRVMMFFNSSKWKKFKESTGLGRSKHSSNFEIACSRAKSEVDLAEKRAQATANEVIIDSVSQVGENMRELQLGVDRLEGRVEHMQTEIGHKLAILI